MLPADGWRAERHQAWARITSRHWRLASQPRALAGATARRSRPASAPGWRRRRLSRLTKSCASTACCGQLARIDLRGLLPLTTTALSNRGVQVVSVTGWGKREEYANPPDRAHNLPCKDNQPSEVGQIARYHRAEESSTAGGSSLAWAGHWQSHRLGVHSTGCACAGGVGV